MEEYLIRKIEEKDIEGTAKVYAEAFNMANNNEGWTQESAEESTRYWFKRRPDLFFVVASGEEIVGGVVGEIRMFCGEYSLAEIELFVAPKYHGKGIAKKLMRKIVSDAISKFKVTEIAAVANSAVKFPMGWYERLGLKQTKWVLIEGKAEEVLNNLEDENGI